MQRRDDGAGADQILEAGAQRAVASSPAFSGRDDRHRAADPAEGASDGRGVAQTAGEDVRHAALGGDERQRPPFGDGSTKRVPVGMLVSDAGERE